MLDDKDIEFTKALYRAFYSRYPDDNPTDINTLNKYKFMKRDRLRLPQEDAVRT